MHLGTQIISLVSYEEGNEMDERAGSNRHLLKEGIL